MDVLLHVGDKSFVLDMDEALKVAEIICAAQFISSTWKAGGNRKVLSQPDVHSASISPFTAILRMELEENSK